MVKAASLLSDRCKGRPFNTSRQSTGFRSKDSFSHTPVRAAVANRKAPRRGSSKLRQTSSRPPIRSPNLLFAVDSRLEHNWLERSARPPAEVSRDSRTAPVQRFCSASDGKLARESFDALACPETKLGLKAPCADEDVSSGRFFSFALALAGAILEPRRPEHNPPCPTEASFRGPISVFRWPAGSRERLFSPC